MKYNEKYDLYIDDDLVIYYWDNSRNKLMQRPILKKANGYLRVTTKLGTRLLHRVIWETFNGEIPDGYELDHINAIKTDNRLDNLRLVTHKENCNNSLTITNISKSMKGKSNAKGKIHSEFGMKFKEHYGITNHQNPKLYNKEQCYYHYHHKCSWE